MVIQGSQSLTEFIIHDYTAKNVLYAKLVLEA